MSEYETFEELKVVVEKSGGLKTVTVASLRDAQGAGKLGKYVVAGIIDSLAKQGLKVYPEDIPLAQYESVRVYMDGTAISKLLDAIQTLETWDDMEANYAADRVIVDTVNAEAQETLQRVKQLVCG